MRLRILLPSLLLLSFAGAASAQQTAQPRLFKRYETGGAYNRVTEDVLDLTIEVAAADRAKIAVRICSQQPFLFALATASADPFRMAELLIGAYSYLPQNVILVRSEDCLGRDPSIVEIWTLPEHGSLPPHVEALASSQVRSSLVGKKPVNRGVRDYVAATHELIKILQANPKARGVVIGYHFKRPSAVLKRRLGIVKSLFQRSGLPSDRYLVHSMHWNDEYSESEGEPPFPRVFLLEEGEFIAVY